jgi:hypothetical protein
MFTLRSPAEARRFDLEGGTGPLRHCRHLGGRYLAGTVLEQVQRSLSGVDTGE